LPWGLRFCRVGRLALIVTLLAFRQAEGARMSGRWKPSSPWLGKRVKQGFRGYPIATIAFYGPTADLATKVVVGIFKQENRDSDLLEKWFSHNSDIRSDDDIGEELVAFIKSHEVKSVVVTDGIIGCPHEEGIDYPEGESCPECPYWAGRDRWTRERIQ